MAAVRQVVGRSRKSDLRIPNRRVSAEHAILAWSGFEWVLRDLGSTNGTYVDGRRLAVGDRIRLRRNSLVAFGDVEDAWRLVSDSPPLPRIVDLSTGEAVRQGGPILGIPSAEEPAITIYWSKSGWVYEEDGRVEALVEDTKVEVDGMLYEIQFPEDLAGTIADTDMDFNESEPLEGFRFIFYGDGQGGVGMDAEGRAGRLQLRPRAHHFTMLTLARKRLEGEREGLDVADAGWLPFDLTAHRLGIDPKTLNVHIHRARQELARHGVVGAAAVVERRSVTRELRFGSSAVTLIDL
jgi:hypothetical protein